MVGWWDFVFAARGPQVDKQPAKMDIMTVDEVAAMLRMSKRSVYEMTSGRGRAKMKHPLPVLRINSSVRFVRKDVEEWVEKLVRGN